VRWDEGDAEGFRMTGRLGFWEKDLQTGDVQWSSDVDAMLGLPRSGRAPTLEDLLAPIVEDEREMVRSAIARSIKNRFEHYHVEYRCRRPDGAEIQVRNEWGVECNLDGVPVVLRGVIQDVTHRKRTKAALQRQTAILVLLYAIARIANEARTPEQALAASLERVCAFGGWPVGHVYLVTDRDTRELVPSDVWYAADPARFEALRAARSSATYSAESGPGSVARRGLPSWSGEIRKHSPFPMASAALAAGLKAALDLPVSIGEDTVAVLEFFAYEDREPEPELLTAMANVASQLGRVFERKRAEEALRASEARLRQILDSMPIGVFVIDRTGEAYYYNKIAKDLTRPDAEIAPPYEVYVAGTEQPYPNEKNPLYRALAGESTVAGDLETRPGGRRVPIEAWGSPVYDERGRIAYALAAFYDISERKKVERLKDEFVSVVSHELRTPLTSIQGAVSLLEHGVLGPIPESALEMVHIASDGCKRLRRLVDELLDVQKLESEKSSLARVPVALDSLLAQAVNVQRPHATALDVTLAIENRSEGAAVMGDEDRLAQVMGNLLSNALKHSPRGSRVVVRAARREGCVRVSVIDRGPGVPAEFHDHLFRKFSQADASDARQKTGTGLGLAISKSIVDKLGGAIGYEPNPEGGSIFWFELAEVPGQ
jgi:PAS domain S-box-containing protein